MISSQLGDVAEGAGNTAGDDAASPAAADASQQSSPVPVQPAQPVRPKPSKAISIWLAVLAAVLVALWLQTRTSMSSYNFLIEGNAEAVGANVTIDGQSVGTLKAEEVGGVKSIVLRTSLRDGQHHIVISKPGYASVDRQISLRGEDFLGVQLNRQ